MNKGNYITLANKAAKIQINELKKIKKVFNNSFIKAIDLILNCKGKVIFAGVGKSGLVARKVSATFSSVGIPSFFCHPSEALHGDMGQIEKKDILLIFSYSGNTTELTSMLKYANRFQIKIIGVGGVDSGQSAYEKIINGANLVQLYTGMIYKGPSIAAKISEELINILEKEGVKNISDIVGSKK